MNGFGFGIGKILEPLGGLTEDLAWMHGKYPQVLKKLAKHPHFAEHGRNAKLMADAYICGFMRGRQRGWIDPPPRRSKRKQAASPKKVKSRSVASRVSHA